MEISDIQKASNLSRERSQLARGLEVLNQPDVTVLAFIVGRKREGERQGPPQMAGFTIDAAGFAHPPQMMDSIKQQAAARVTAIDAELKKLGVTGAEDEAAARKKKA